jgi:hypothetical protein
LLARQEAKAARPELAMGEVVQRVGAAFFLPGFFLPTTTAGTAQVLDGIKDCIANADNTDAADIRGETYLR